MTQESNQGTASSRSNPEQIDLIELVMQLWREKNTIIASVVVVLMLAVVYLFVAKEEWTSTAVVSQPDVAQIATYNTALKVLYPDASINVTDIQNRVMGRFSAALSSLSNQLDNLEEPEKLSIEPAIKGREYPIQVSYVGTSAEEAQKTLAQYLQKVDEQIADELHLDLNDSIKQQILTLSSSLETQETVAEEQRTLRLKQIKEALKYAQEANIVKPQQQQPQDVTQDTLFLLGSEGLSAMIKNEATRPLVFSGNYYQTKNNLLDIERIKVDPKTIHAYRYVMKPDLPIRRDSPKRAIVLVLAVLLGGMIGSGIVLGRNALREYRNRH
ncbi:MAG: LPS O-antigen chain length determinant protein WzzB [Kluyvera sp.]|uniref:LPS O-antigen chain length determinant protein WzzB n=1 Tax=Kluyvera sp. TaxID=1538228 RepID=UPI003F3450D2